MRLSARQPCIRGRHVALFGEAREWHTVRLVRALQRRGAHVTVLSLRDCSIETARKHQLHLPGLGESLPDGAIVRSVPGGTFEAVTLRLGVLHALAAKGIPVWNDPRAIERCVDKSMTSLLLAQAGLPTPVTWVVQGHADAAALVGREASADTPLVLKPLFGAQGRGLSLIQAVEDLPSAEEVSDVYYLQQFVGLSRNWRDVRCFVSCGRILAAMVRHGTGWITNIHQGARAESYMPEPEVAALALGAAAAVRAAYAGVDLIQDSFGRWFILEVNSMPAWSGLQSVTSFNISQHLVDDFGAMLTRGMADESLTAYALAPP